MLIETITISHQLFAQSFFILVYGQYLLERTKIKLQSSYNTWLKLIGTYTSPETVENSHIRSSYMTHIISVLYLRRRGLIKSQVKLQPCFSIDGIFNRFLYVTLDFLLEVHRLVFTCQPSPLYTQLHPLMTSLKVWVLFLPHFRRSGVKTRMLLSVNYSN